MTTDILWINEGFMQDDAGNLIITSYVDLREPGSRTPIRTLVKGCRREHALEDSETIQMSALKEFRDEGENLIRDPQEGLAKEEVGNRHTGDAGTGFATAAVSRISTEAFEFVDAEMKLRFRCHAPQRGAVERESRFRHRSGGSSRRQSLRKPTRSGRRGVQPSIPPTTTSP